MYPALHLTAWDWETEEYSEYNPSVNTILSQISTVFWNQIQTDRL